MTAIRNGGAFMQITKDMLKSYGDALAIIEEAEHDLKRLKENNTEEVSTTVTGSSSEYPYCPKHFKVEGIKEKNPNMIKKQEEYLKRKKAAAEEIRQQIQDYILTCPLRIQRIIEYKYIKLMSWNEVARKFGNSCNSESIRKELNRFLKK